MVTWAVEGLGVEGLGVEGLAVEGWAVEGAVVGGWEAVCTTQIKRFSESLILKISLLLHVLLAHHSSNVSI